ncbi:4544_t:CDS:10, partial [Ambispora leptoticha]
MSTQSDLWQGLSTQMKESTRWSQTIFQWKKTMDRLTKILSKHLYQVDLEAVDLNRRLSELSISERHRRKPSKNRTRHLSLKDSRHKSSGSNSSREEIVSPDYSSTKSASEIKTSRRVASMHQDDSKLLGGQALLNFVSNGFNANSEMPIEENSGVKSNRTSTSSALFAQPNFSSDRISSSLANFKSPEFLSLDSLPWNCENSLMIWKNMLCALGNIPPNHSDAIKGLVHLWDTLNLIRDNQPYSNVPLPLLYEFAPWFLEACDMPLAFAPGRALAYGGICKMMSRKQDQEVPNIYYSHFYRALLKGLSDTDTSITYAIINNSTRLFAQVLPGSNILFYRFIESILNLLTKHDRSHLPESTRQNAITILCSLICILNQNPDLKVPIIPYHKLTKLKMIDLDSSSFDHKDSISCSELRLILVEILVQALATEENIHNPETHIMILQGICTLAFDEVTSTPSPAKTIVKECFSALFDQLYWSHLPVVCAAADCLIVFAQNCSITWDDDGMYLMVLQDLFGNLIGALNEHLNLQRGAQRNGRGFIIAKLFYCLLEWLMVIPSKLFTETELYQLVFEAIDLAFEITGNDSPRYHDKLLPIPPNKSRGKRHIHDATVRFKKADRKISLSASLNNEHGVHVVGADSIEDPELVKEIAECVLLHLTHHLDNFAPPHGPAMTN